MSDNNIYESGGGGNRACAEEGNRFKKKKTEGDLRMGKRSEKLKSGGEKKSRVYLGKGPRRTRRELRKIR